MCRGGVGGAGGKPPCQPAVFIWSPRAAEGTAYGRHAQTRAPPPVKLLRTIPSAYRYLDYA